jgi:phage-related protein
MEEDRVRAIYFFVDKDGNRPVKEFIDSLTKKEQSKAHAYFTELKKEWNNLRRPMADYLKDGIYELRPKNNRIFYFFYLREKAILVHAIKKYVKRIPADDLRLCIKRRLETEACGTNIEKLEL